MRIHVVIASMGRADLLWRTVDRLQDQSRVPDGVLLAVTGANDVEGISQSRLEPHILLCEIGAARQRNAALDHLDNNSDVVVFFDDDFVPAHDYIENVEALLTENPDWVGLTGKLVDDGIRGEPIPFKEAEHRLDVDEEKPELGITERSALYGCNMAIRLSVAGDLRFDENLPLYSWLEDVDYTYQLGERGPMYACPELTGIHLGTRRARSPGLRLGYSQVANVIYLLRKGTIVPSHGRRLVTQNLIANCLRSIVPDKGIDRRGRLKGNLLAVVDWLRGNLDPRRILKF